MRFFNSFISGHPYGFTYNNGFQMLFLEELEWRLWWLTVKLGPRAAYMTQPREWWEDQREARPTESTS